MWYLQDNSPKNQFFEQIMGDFDKLRKRGVFLQNFTKEPNFEMDEFDTAR